MDAIFWKVGQFSQKKDAEQVAKEINEIHSKDRWIVEGVFGEIAEQLIDRATLVIWLNLPWSECRNNLIDRGAQPERFKNPSESDASFSTLLLWAEQYWTRSGRCSAQFHSTLMNKTKSPVELKSRAEIGNFLASI